MAFSVMGLITYDDNCSKNDNLYFYQQHHSQCIICNLNEEVCSKK
jgi:hypothetical protein